MPDITITPKGKTYQSFLNKQTDGDSLSQNELTWGNQIHDDDWDVLHEIEHNINYRGSVTDDYILSMPSRGQGLGSLSAEGRWDEEEEWNRVRSSLRRMFEAGYIDYA